MILRKVTPSVRSGFGRIKPTLMVKITFLYFEDCPSHEIALSRLQEVLLEEGIEAEIEIVRVEGEDQARGLNFIGSPSIRIDGEDILPHTDDEIVGLSCRVFVLEDGRISPLPSYEMIREGLRRGIEGGSLRS
jgi:hypothetical protein